MISEASGRPLSQNRDRPLSVLTFTSLFPNGIDPTHGIFIAQRMKYFAELGHRVVVVAPVPYVPVGLRSRSAFAKVAPFEQFAGMDVYHPRYPLVPKISMPFHGNLMYLGARKLVHSLHAENRFDLVDAHYVYPDGFAGVKLARLLGLPSVVSARGSDINLFTQFTSIRPQIKWCLNQADAAVAVSDGLKRKMLDLGIPDNKVKIIANGVDAGNFRPQDRAESRRRLGIPMDIQVLVCVAGLVETKGHAILLEAVAALKEKFPKLHLYSIGKGKLLQQLTEKIHSLSLGDRVTFVGSLPHDELPYWFSAADLSCLISAREGCPNAVAESLACGCPVIGSYIPGIQELVSNEYLGRLTQRQPQAVAATIDQALSVPWNREQIAGSMAGRTWTDVAREVERLFLTVLNPTESLQKVTPVP